MKALQNRLSSDLARGAVAIALAGAFIVAAFAGTLGAVLNGKLGDHQIRAVFADAQQLRNGDEVRVHGVKVGEVTGIDLDRGARSATVTMRVTSAAADLRRDASASVNIRTLLGGAFYVALNPGSAKRSLASAAIPVTATHGQVELDDVASVVQAGARTGLRRAPTELARALRDPQAPARALSTLAAGAPTIGAAANALRGEEQDRDLRSLVSATAGAMSALDVPDQQLRDVVSGAAATVDTTANRRADLIATLSEAPGVIRDTTTTALRLDHTLPLADHVLTSLRRSAGKVAPSVHALNPTLQQANGLLSDARPLLRDLRPAAASLSRASAVGLPVLKQLQPSIRRLNDTILPRLGAYDPATGLRTSEMVGPGLNGIGAGASAEDANGHFVRFPASAGQTPVVLPCQEYAGTTNDQLVECQGLQKTLQTLEDALGSAPSTGGSKP